MHRIGKTSFDTIYALIALIVICRFSWICIQYLMCCCGYTIDIKDQRNARFGCSHYHFVILSLSRLALHAGAKRAPAMASTSKIDTNDPKTVKHLVACLKEGVDFVHVLSSCLPALQRLLSSSSAETVKETVMFLQYCSSVGDSASHRPLFSPGPPFVQKPETKRHIYNHIDFAGSWTEEIAKLRCAILPFSSPC